MNAQSGFVKTQRTAPRRSDDEMQALRSRKGKRNKSQRSQRNEWESV